MIGTALGCVTVLTADTTEAPTFNRDILPILRNHCQQCHRPGEVAPMPLVSYQQTRPWAKAIREEILLKRMPPWFAEPGYGPFANDPSLSRQEIETVAKWAQTGAAEGDALNDSPAPLPVEHWNISKPDEVVEMPRPFSLPATGDVDYQYIVMPVGFKEDKWVEMAELRPGNRTVVHHAVVYIREPGSSWLRDAQPGIPYVPPGDTPKERLRSGATKSDILLVYSPGSLVENWGPAMGKLIRAGSDLVFQMHYTPSGRVTSDQSKLGLVFSRTAPSHRVVTLQLGNDHFVIPPEHPHFRVVAWGTIPNDTLLLSLFPHMHLRGASFEYAVVEPDGQRRSLLRVNPYNFHWQLSYRLAKPLPIKGGTRLECVAYFDNSRNNPANPDPGDAVHFGPQSSEEMMIGFFDVAIAPQTDKAEFFVRPH
jgi:hypothetical protein